MTTNMVTIFDNVQSIATGILHSNFLKIRAEKLTGLIVRVRVYIQSATKFPHIIFCVDIFTIFAALKLEKHGFEDV